MHFFILFQFVQFFQFRVFLIKKSCPFLCLVLVLAENDDMGLKGFVLIMVTLFIPNYSCAVFKNGLDID